MEKQAEQLILPYLVNLQGLALVIDAAFAPNRRTKGLQLRLRTRGGHRTTYEVERLDGPPTQALAQRLAATHPGRTQDRWIILAPLVTRAMAKVLVQHHIDYMDKAGNCHLAPAPDQLVHVEGRAAEGEGRVRTFRPQGYQVLFALLARPGMVAEPIREIARQAGVGKTVVGQTIERLEGEGQIAQTRRGRELIRPANLVPRWLTGYADALRPKFQLGRFKFPAGDRDLIPQRVAELMNRQVERWGLGGTAGGDKLTQHYRGTTITVHMEEIPPDFTQAVRALPAGEGDLIVLRAPGPIAYEGPIANVVHPLHVYTELMCSGDERAWETAQLVLDQYLPELK